MCRLIEANGWSVRRVSGSHHIYSKPGSFSSAPGKGVTCKVEGRTIIVGSRAYLREAGVAVPDSQKTLRAGSLIFIAATWSCLGRNRVWCLLCPGGRKSHGFLRDIALYTFFFTRVDPGYV